MAESYVRVPADDVGKKLRTRLNTIGADDVHSEVFVLEDGSGNLIIPLSEAGTVNVSNGTLQTVTQIGTLPNIVVGSGTLQAISSPITVASGTVVISGGTLTGSNPSAGSLDVITQVGTLPNIIIGSGTVQYIGNVGTLPAIGGTVGVADGTLTTVTRIGTLPNVIIESGTLQAISSPITVSNGTVSISSGTLTAVNPSAGTLDVVTQIGTLPNITVGSGTIQQVTNCYLAGVGTVVVGSGTVTTSLLLTEGTLNVVSEIGTLPNVVVGSGTLQSISGNVNVIVQSGTLQTLNNGTLSSIGTLPNIIVGSGTLQAITGNVPTIPQSGTLQQVTACYLAGSGTVRVAAGTVILGANSGVDIGNIDIASGTLLSRTQVRLAGAPGAFADVGLGTYTPMPILGTVQTVSAGTINTVGTVYYQPNLGTLYAVTGNVKTIPQSGTLQAVTAVTSITNNVNTVSQSGTLQNLGTVTQLGSANIYSKHDLHVYDTLGTIMTAAGTLVQTASKIIKVHQFSVLTDGSLGWSFNDTKPTGGTVHTGGYFTQREGIVEPFIPYPAYHFKTSTAGSALCLGTYATGISGTAYINLVYTDDDAT